ncbi:M56 family metallopeptidase [Labilibaculum sp.]|uniref:M56 family metallopeptidase n=1 Tax=Labilibaculum sp. TaxID=2060723 RepID=UPI00356AC715
MYNINLYDWSKTIGWTLFHSTWQVTVIGVIIWLIFRFISKDNARIRYALSGLGLVIICIAFTITFYHYLPKETNKALVDLGQQIQLTDFEQFEESFFSHLWIQVSSRIENSFPILVNIWIIGMFFLSINLILKYINTQKLKTHLTFPLRSEYKEITDRIITKYQLKQNIIFKESGFLEIPSVIGYFKPFVILPISILSGIPKNQLEIIIAHELAHIRRHDYLLQFIQGIIELVFFYHPVVWWLSSVVNAEREHICDDLAVTVCGESLTLIKALNNMEAIRKKQYKMVLGFSGKKGKVLGRINRILRPKVTINPRRERFMLSGVFTLLFIGLFLVSNFAISGNTNYQKSFSKINLLDQENKSPKKGEHETFVQPKDSLKSEDWVKTKAEEIIREQVENNNNSLLNILKSYSIDELRKGVQQNLEALNNSSPEKYLQTLIQREKEIDIKLKEKFKNSNSDKTQNELKEQLLKAKEKIAKKRKEFNSDEFLSRIEEQKRGLSQELQKIESPEFNQIIEEEIQDRKKEILESKNKLNSLEYKNRLENFLRKNAKQEWKSDSPELIIRVFHQDSITPMSNVKVGQPMTQNTVQTGFGTVPSFSKIAQKNTTEKPLIILDGKEITQEQMDQIPPNEIAKINVVKDVSATALYGAVGGANGVILITSKSESNNLKADSVVVGYGTPKQKGILFNSISNPDSGKQPLILLDGKKITREQMDEIASEIKSISVIKDTSARELYGDEGKNGVILITSKSNNTLADQIKLVSSKNAPLYIVDGKKTPVMEAEKIDPNTIKSMNALKGTKATDKYGEEAKNGVLLIELIK